MSKVDRSPGSAGCAPPQAKAFGKNDIVTIVSKKILSFLKNLEHLLTINLINCGKWELL